MLCLEKSLFSNLFKFDRLLNELPDTYCKSNEVYDAKTKEMVQSAAYLLSKNKDALDSWKSTHLTYLKKSSHILNYIGKYLHKVNYTFRQSQYFDKKFQTIIGKSFPTILIKNHWQILCDP